MGEGRGVEGGWKFLVTEKKKIWGLKTKNKKCSWDSETHTQNFFLGGGGDFGVPHAPTRGSRGVGKRYTSSYDHDL